MHFNIERGFIVKKQNLIIKVYTLVDNYLSINTVQQILLWILNSYFYCPLFFVQKSGVR